MNELIKGACATSPIQSAFYYFMLQTDPVGEWSVTIGGGQQGSKTHTAENWKRVLV